ncbi:hypothetical protein D9M71_847680 [compost metagenome]
MAAVLDQAQGFRAHAHPCFGRCLTGSHRFFGDVDHVGAALGIEMGEHGREFSGGADVSEDSLSPDAAGSRPPGGAKGG